ncbi:MAG: PH domain-containing protein [Gammaproteobacteria bacterium]|nr:PH domain-containing protein [Gammaproteobacteria bacterium]
MRYRTTIGSYAVILGLGPTGIALAMASFWLIGAWPMVGSGAALLCVFGWVLLGTQYVIEQGVLVVRMGPVCKRIALRDITRVHRRPVHYGPMLGLGSDFIGIEYGENKSVNVSPTDREGFVEAVKQGTRRPGRP